MKIKELEFIGSYQELSRMPKDRLPEIAFVGRSNVGKSSLINHLCRQKIAKTSSVPGKTQLINFFKINRKFYLVDLPGYGYAQVALSVKKNWEKFIELYLQQRETLRVIFLLLDIRRVPNEQDQIVSTWMKTLAQSGNLIPVYVLTKTDKLARSEINKNKAEIAKTLFVSQHEMILHSSLKNVGREEIFKKMEEALLL